jgi:hypothetical protein
MAKAIFGVSVVAMLALFTFSPATFAAQSLSAAGSDVAGDFGYLIDNTQLDLEDIVTSPLYITSPNSVFRKPEFYLVTAGLGAVWGGSFALDQTMKSHLRSMSSSDANLLENVSYDSVSITTGLMYAYGLYEGDDRARHLALTAGEGAGVATLLDIGIKAAFGRLRPRQTSSHTAFFHGGASFVSGDVTPMFGLAAGVSEYFDNRWYVAAPIYSLALLDGFGRMGHNAHWFSDVVGAGILGWGTTELFIHLHKEHALQPDRWRLIPLTQPPGPISPNQVSFLDGMAVSYSF